MYVEPEDPGVRPKNPRREYKNHGHASKPYYCILLKAPNQELVWLVMNTRFGYKLNTLKAVKSSSLTN